MKVPVRLVKIVPSINRQKNKTREQTKRSIYAKTLFLKRKRAYVKIEFEPVTNVSQQKML